MESAIGIGLEAVRALVALIGDIRSTPDFIADIRDTAHQFRGILEGSMDLLKVRYLNNKQFGEMLSSQKICTGYLQAITEILRHFVSTEFAQMSLFRKFQFQFGSRGELSSLKANLTSHMVLLGTLLDQLRANAPKRSDSPSISQNHRPVMSIDEIAYMKSNVAAPESASGNE